ncbi:MAG: preprotein translocase subunit SecE [Proteobacteria bacterium]|jgi:preprotein translocase SecE subunit|nr:preprotein translocase subunit SecE [Pseudomonadota bacterium]
MENQRQKWVNLVFTGLAILVAGVSFIGLSRLSAVYNLESSIKQIDLVIRFGSLILGAALGFGLYLNDKSNAFMNEVVLEMVRVTWPASKDTTNATVWVVLFVLVAGGLLGAFDSLLVWIMNMVL